MATKQTAMIEALEAQIRQLHEDVRYEQERANANREWALSVEQELAEERSSRAEAAASLATMAQTAGDPFEALAHALGMNAKTLYRTLARAMHPDVGGDTAAMQALTGAWSARH